MSNTIDLNEVLPNKSNPHVLIWKKIVDHRPLQIDKAILWFHEGDKWIVAHVVRNSHSNDSTKWDSHIVFDAPSYPYEVFDHSPSTDEIRIFLKNTRWIGNSAPNYKLIEGAICEDTWLKVTHEIPENIILHL